METIIVVVVGVPCFHRFERLAGINVRKCEFKLANSGCWFHVIHFKEPVANAHFRCWPSIRCVHNAKNEVTEMWERVSSVAVSSLHNIGPDAHHRLLHLLTVHATKYVVNLVKDEIVNLALCCSPSTVGRTFMENVGSIIYVNDDTLQFMQMNRFTLKPGSVYKEKVKIKLLRKQLTNLFFIIKYMYFVKKTKRAEAATTAGRGPSASSSSNAAASCVDACKLKCYSERFLYADYAKIHFFFCQIYSGGNNSLIENVLQLCRMLGDRELDECADEAVRKVA